MNSRMRTLAVGSLVGLAGVFAGAGLVAAQQSGEGQQPEMQLPEGWAMEDMQACIEAGTPGEMHEVLVSDAGTWHGKSTFWMAPGAELTTSENVTTVTPIMDGRYVRVEMRGEMPGMGPHHGEGLYGYDNVSEEFVSTWIDNWSTGIMQGTGKRSSDGKTMTWNYSYNCPITGEKSKMREVETRQGPDRKTLTLYATDPKSGEEYKMGVIELQREGRGETLGG